MTKSDADFSLDAEMQKDIDVQILLCSNSTSICFTVQYVFTNANLLAFFSLS